MTQSLAYIFHWLAWLSVWCSTKGITIIDVLLCAAPAMLAAGFIWTQVIDIHPRGVWIHGQHYQDTWRDD